MAMGIVKNKKSTPPSHTEQEIKKQSFLIIAMSPVGEGLSGGDRIFIELARNFSRMHLSVQIITWGEGIKMIERQQLDKVSSINYQTLSVGFWSEMGFIVCFLARIVRSITWAIGFKSTSDFVYSASDFWMDVFPAVILRLKNKKIKWIASWYQTAPHPFSGFASPFYWLSQLFSKPLIKRFADFVIVNNEDERKQFSSLDSKGKVFVMIGAVDMEKINNQSASWRTKIKNPSKIYDAVFQGRFHSQKGVLELIDIWRKIVDKKPKARLVMIGDGPLMQDVRRKIYDLRLKDNIVLKGYLFDGDEKYNIFQSAKIVVHPALYDSGGMAAGEAMVFGLPCVGFDLKAYHSYYPQGMVKVPIGDLNQFAEAVFMLMDNKNKREKIGKEGMQFIKNYNSWKYRTKQLLESIQSI